MAPQPSGPATQPPPDLPSMPDVSTTLSNYLRTFSLWCRNMFRDKLDANTALPGILLQATDQAVSNPPVYMLGVTSGGQGTLATVNLGSGAPNAPQLGPPIPFGQGQYLPLGGGSLTGGLHFGSVVAASPTDLSRHIDLYGGAYGFSVTNGTLNIVSDGAAEFQISNGGVNLNGVLNATGTIQAMGAVYSKQAPGGGNCHFGLMRNDSTVMSWFYTTNDGNIYLQNNTTGSILLLRSDGYFICNSNAAKPGGGVWADSSDARIKTVQGDYTLGLDQVLQLNPVIYTFKGNDTPTADPNAVPDPDASVQPASVTEAPYPASHHYTAAQAQTPYVGFIAQDLEKIFPGMVSQGEGYIDGEAVTDLRTVDVSNLIYALVNAVKTLSARVEALEK